MDFSSIVGSKLFFGFECISKYFRLGTFLRHHFLSFAKTVEMRFIMIFSSLIKVRLTWFRSPLEPLYFRGAFTKRFCL